MSKVTTIIIGAGQTGLAMSRELSQRGIDHVVLERGEIANSWRRERWDSLRLLTPNWLNGLPGQAYEGDDPYGFMSVNELIGDFDRFAAKESLPIVTGAQVHSIKLYRGGYHVQTDAGVYAAHSVVVATGACAQAKRPKFASELPQEIQHLTPLTYKRPSDLADGGVLVVGASASGVQIARELQRSGRQVTLAVGSHTRVPRQYRGADILMWMHILGHLDKTFDQVDSLERVRRLPSFQLSGEPGQQMLDLNALQDIGVELTGRLAGIRDGRLQFSGGFANMCASADLKMNRLLTAIDSWVDRSGFCETIEPQETFTPTRVPTAPRLSLDVRAEGIRSVVWATGYRPDHSFLKLPIFDARGRVQHQGGVIRPGLYVMGLMFLRRLSSSFIDGAGADAFDLAEHLQAYLSGRGRIAA